MNHIQKNGSIRLGGQGCLSNGALHWIELDGSRSRIISFDLAREKFQELVSLSSFVDKEFLDHNPSYGTFVGIGSTIEDSLLVYFYVPSHTSETTLTVWVMNEYGVKASWTKLVHISPKIDLPWPRFGIHDSLFPVRILENGEVLMSCNEHELVQYNPKEKTYKTVLVTNLSCEGVMYAKTLVSPVIDGGVTSNQRGGEAEASKTTPIDCFETSCLNINKTILGITKKPWKLRMELIRGPNN